MGKSWEIVVKLLFRTENSLSTMHSAETSKDFALELNNWWCYLTMSDPLFFFKGKIQLDAEWLEVMQGSLNSIDSQLHQWACWPVSSNLYNIGCFQEEKKLRRET